MYPQALRLKTGDDLSMGMAEKYQRFAEECMELKDAQAKAALLHMAHVWLRFRPGRTRSRGFFIDAADPAMRLQRLRAHPSTWLTVW